MLGLLAGIATIAERQSQETDDGVLIAAPANSHRDKADTTVARTKAEDQPNAKTDRALAAAVRQAIVRDKSLSSYAHNVKVIAQDGQVTLKGPVRSEDEKRAVEAKAAEIVGAAHVTNEVSVAPAPAKGAKQ